MNSVNLIGRLTRDPERRNSGDMAIVNFTVAIDRGRTGPNGEKETDFPRVVAFGKTAELAERWLRKGARVGISGHIQTGSFTNQAGDKVYTTDVICERLTIIDWPDDRKETGVPSQRSTPEDPFNVDDIGGAFPF